MKAIDLLKSTAAIAAFSLISPGVATAQQESLELPQTLELPAESGLQVASPADQPESALVDPAPIDLDSLFPDPAPKTTIAIPVQQTNPVIKDMPIIREITEEIPAPAAPIPGNTPIFDPNSGPTPNDYVEPEAATPVGPTAAQLRQARALYKARQRTARLEHNLWMGYEPLRPNWRPLPVMSSRYSDHHIVVPVYFPPK